MPECARLKSSLCPCPMHMQFKSRQDIMMVPYRKYKQCVLFSNKNKMRFHNKYKASKIHTCNWKTGDPTLRPRSFHDIYPTQSNIFIRRSSWLWRWTPAPIPRFIITKSHQTNILHIQTSSIIPVQFMKQSLDFFNILLVHFSQRHQHEDHEFFRIHLTVPSKVHLKKDISKWERMNLNIKNIRRSLWKIVHLCNK